jgi:hypothetical protein
MRSKIVLNQELNSNKNENRKLSNLIYALYSFQITRNFNRKWPTLIDVQIIKIGI